MYDVRIRLCQTQSQINDICVQAFNEELDGMFNDVNLPADQAWAAMTRDLRQTKESRNALNRENS